MISPQYEIKIFSTSEGKEPFSDWLEKFNNDVKKRIILRVNRIRFGNLGDYKNLGEGILELRLSFGSGYRIYFGSQDKHLIILLCGGDKKSPTILARI